MKIGWWSHKQIWPHEWNELLIFFISTDSETLGSMDAAEFSLKIL